MEAALLSAAAEGTPAAFLFHGSSIYFPADASALVHCHLPEPKYYLPVNKTSCQILKHFVANDSFNNVCLLTQTLVIDACCMKSLCRATMQQQLISMALCDLGARKFCLVCVADSVFCGPLNSDYYQ